MAENQNNDSFLDEYSGEGTGDLGGGVAYLQLLQKISNEQIDMQWKLGDFVHTGLNQNFGNSVNVVLMGWKPLWVEKSEEGKTLAYHLPDSIELNETGIGAKDYRCVSCITGNKVERSILIPLMIFDAEDSLCIYIPNVKSLPAMREFRKALKMNRLSSGALAPIFSNVWTMKSAVVKDGKNTYQIVQSVTKGARITQDYMLNAIAPVRELTMNPLALLPSRIEDARDVTQEADVDVRGSEVFV